MKAGWAVALLLWGAQAQAQVIELLGSDSVASMIEPYRSEFAARTGHQLVLRATGSQPALERLKHWPGGLMLSEPAQLHALPYLYRVGSDSVIFLVQQDNPLQQLPLSALQGLLEEGAHWPDGRPVTHYSLGRQHATGQFVQSFFARKEPISATVLRNPYVLLTNIANDPSALGWLSLRRWVSIPVKGQRALAIDGEVP